jgi:hypothetical protein
MSQRLQLDAILRGGLLFETELHWKPENKGWYQLREHEGTMQRATVSGCEEDLEGPM